VIKNKSLEFAKTESLDRETFLRAQDILKVTLKDEMSLSDAQKEGLATFLGISPAQLDYCIKAKLLLEPAMNELFFRAEKCGITTNHLTHWFDHIKSQRENETKYKNEQSKDSAYHSTNSTHEQTLEPPNKRRRKDGNYEQRTYQCTFRAIGAKPCFREIVTATDWRRHEETHWPQRRWECLMEGVAPDITCHICGGTIDVDEKDYLRSHDACLGRAPRTSHDFSRKDKLASHVSLILY
jgi:hypothetical protein